MRIGPLTLFSRTSDGKTISLAYWHSPHSLTWRWALSLRRRQVMWPKPAALRNPVGFGAGLGALLSFHAYRTNGGWQWDVSLLWHGLSFSQQRPMWFKDMWQRANEERDALRGDGNVEAWACDEYRDGVSAGAAARQLCRSLGANGAAPTLKRMLEDMLAKANKASFDRSCILRDFADADPEAASEAEMASYRRINGIAEPAADGPPAGIHLN